MSKPIISLLLSSILFISCSNNKSKKEDKPKDSVEIVDDNKLTEGKLIWEDNFEQEGVFNTDNWTKITRGTPDWKNTMSPADTLFENKDNKLILKGMENTIVPEDSVQFLTGGVYTKDKKSFGFGRWEIRAKLDAATGAWPAIWLMPQDPDVGWPNAGEIDIMERLNHDDFVYQTVHSHYTVNLENNNPKPSTTTQINTKDYNTYAVEVHPDKIVFFVNDEKTLTYSDNGSEGQFPFKNYEFYLLIDMQLGGDWVGEVEPNELPVEMKIDWVKFYSFED